MLRVGVVAVLAALFALPASAKELSALQTAVEISRDELSSAESIYRADANRVKADQKELERVQQLLAADQKKAAQSKQKYDEAKARYDRAQSALDRAWKQ